MMKLKNVVSAVKFINHIILQTCIQLNQARTRMKAKFGLKIKVKTSDICINCF